MAQTESPASPAPTRFLSIDALRGLTILVMIFVNDVAGVHDTPLWMQHFYGLNPDNSKNWEANGFTFVDVVFPAFLFIVGMAIPFALDRRLDRGDSIWKVWGHVLLRTISLLICGVFMVNMHGQQELAIPLTLTQWKVLVYLCLFFTFHITPREPGRWRMASLWIKGIGIAGLAILALTFERTNGEGLRTHWWGILGLIGWAYFTGCIAYTFLRRNVAGLVGVMALLYCAFLADAGNPSLTDLFTRGWVGVGSQIGSHGAIVVSGIILGIMLRPDSPLKTHTARIRWATLYGVALAIAALLIYRLHDKADVSRLFIINKNIATPTWCLWCSAITIWVWVVIYGLIDVMKCKKWAVILWPAGANPLMAYILAPFVYAVLVILSISWPYDKLGEAFATGFFRSVFWAVAITWFAGFLGNRGIRLRL